MNKNALTVKQLNFYVKSLIEGDLRLNNICVKGEISNLKSHYSSGHIYFTLKDNDAAINCVMFRSFASRIKFTPENGIQVILRGRVSIYEKDGQYQFYAEEMIADGIGDITLKFEQTKAKLEAEGLFSSENKRKLPEFPKRIAVITSKSGAALQDILNILSRRWPLAEVVICPATVQGETAANEMISVLDRVYSLDGIDVIIIGRGGGSIEDLWAFNDENLARKIYESPFPVVSAVGHETDFTICDFVADLRAPTPSAAAELVVPDIAEITALLRKYKTILSGSLENKYKYCLARLDTLSSNRIFKFPSDTFINRNIETVDRLYDRMNTAVNMKKKDLESKLSSIAAALDSLSPLKTISRGYAAVKRNEKSVTSVNDLSPADIIEIGLSDGTAECEVKTVKRSELLVGKQ